MQVFSSVLKNKTWETVWQCELNTSGLRVFDHMLIYNCVKKSSVLIKVNKVQNSYRVYFLISNVLKILHSIPNQSINKIYQVCLVLVKGSKENKY